MTHTAHRLLRLLSLLQSRPVWSGPQLADELGVTTRSIRRDVGRLRELGYPVDAMQGTTGGYRLGAGKALPPLLLDDDEAVAVAISLRLASASPVTSASEAALRTLAKLDQVMPPRLRSEVSAILEATSMLPGAGSDVDGDVLLCLARARRDLLRVRFCYTAGDGSPSERRVEPYQLVATGRRWYLMAWDLDRDDWRTFRLDRMTDVVPTTLRFRLRDHPDPVPFVQSAISAAPYRFVARALFHASAAAVQERVPAAVGVVEPADDGTCVFVAGADDLHLMAFHLARVGYDFEVQEPPALREVLARFGARMSAAGRGATDGPGSSAPG